MIDYNSFHSYLCELVDMYHSTQSLKGMSAIARKWHCAALTKEQFFKMNLDKMTSADVTPQYSRMVRDVIGKHDVKVFLRDTIGGAAIDLLREGKVTQSGERMVQITITQPLQSQTPVQAPAPKKTETKAAPLPLYKPGQIVFRKGKDGGMLHLVSRIEGDRFYWSHETLKGDDGIEYVYENTSSSSWLGNTDIRPAKGNEVARFIGALTRSGYRWKADNTNGLFYVLGKEKENKAVEVFANDLPFGDGIAIYPLPSISPSPYRYIIGRFAPIDNAGDFMTPVNDTAMLNAVVRQIRSVIPTFDHIREMEEYDVPTLCCSEWVKEYRIAFVKDDNNGTSYWLAKDRDVLRLLAWIAYIV